MAEHFHSAYRVVFEQPARLETFEGERRSRTIAAQALNAGAVNWMRTEASMPKPPDPGQESMPSVSDLSMS